MKFRNVKTGHIDDCEFWLEVYKETYKDSIRDKQTLARSRAQIQLESDIKDGLLVEIN